MCDAHLLIARLMTSASNILSIFNLTCSRIAVSCQCGIERMSRVPGSRSMRCFVAFMVPNFSSVVEACFSSISQISVLTCLSVIRLRSVLSRQDIPMNPVLLVSASAVGVFVLLIGFELRKPKPVDFKILSVRRVSRYSIQEFNSPRFRGCIKLGNGFWFAESITRFLRKARSTLVKFAIKQTDFFSRLESHNAIRRSNTMFR